MVCWINLPPVSGNTLSTPSLSPFQYVNTYTSDCGNTTCADFDENLGPETTNWNEYHGGYISSQATQFLIEKITNSNPSFTCSALDFCTNSFQITGPSTVCSTATYRITSSGSLNGVNVTWQFPNGTLTATGGQGTPVVTVTAVGAGNETVTAVLTNSCGQQITIQLLPAVAVGSPSVTNISYAMDNAGCSAGYQRWNLAATANIAVTSWQWTIDNAANNSWYISSPASASTSVNVTNGTGGGITVSATNGCGTGKSGVTIWSPCGHKRIHNIAPNPAHNQITVSTISEGNNIKSSQDMMYSIKITDRYGVVRKQLSYQPGVSSATISVADLNAGTYLVSIFNGEEWSSEPLLIQK